MSINKDLVAASSTPLVLAVLHRLERSGLVESRWEKAETGRRRKYYRVTEVGRQQLAEERRQWRTVDRALRKVWLDMAEFTTSSGRPVFIPQQS